MAFGSILLIILQFYYVESIQMSNWYLQNNYVNDYYGSLRNRFFFQVHAEFTMVMSLIFIYIYIKHYYSPHL